MSTLHVPIHDRLLLLSQLLSYHLVNVLSVLVSRFWWGILYSMYNLCVNICGYGA